MQTVFGDSKSVTQLSVTGRFLRSLYALSRESVYRKTEDLSEKCAGKEDGTRFENFRCLTWLSNQLFSSSRPADKSLQSNAVNFTSPKVVEFYQNLITECFSISNWVRNPNTKREKCSSNVALAKLAERVQFLTILWWIVKNSAMKIRKFP